MAATIVGRDGPRFALGADPGGSRRPAVTPLDDAHAAMTAAPEDAGARLRFYEALCEGELVVLLARAPEADAEPEPALFQTEDGTLALAFDSEERLSTFSGAAAAYAALPGRALMQALAGRGLGLGVNLGVAPSEYLLPPDAVDWLAEMVTHPPQAVEAVPQVLVPPDLPQPLLEALARKLGHARGLAKYALLAGAQWPDGHDGHLLVFVGAAPGAEGALSQALGEALVFSGEEERVLNLAFLAPGDAVAERIAKVALRFDLPKPVPEQPRAEPVRRTPPEPPRLR